MKYKGGISVTEMLGSMTEPFLKLMDSYSFYIKCAAPGIIKSFDRVKQTVTVQLVIKERFTNEDGTTEDVKVKPLYDVPIFMPRAGNFILTMPIAVGDECLVVFGDNCYDTWYQNGGEENLQNEKRRHDLSDGFAIVGIWSQPRKVSNYSTDSAVLRNLDNDSYVEVKESTINVITTNNVNVEAPIVNIECQSHRLTASSWSIEDTGLVKNITATTINLTGSGGVLINGGSTSINVSGSKTQIDGKTFLDHTHLEHDMINHTKGVD